MKIQKAKFLRVGALVSVVAPLMLSNSAMAWGPERPTYTNNAPADHAVFNSITDNPVLGDERDFVRIVELRDGDDAEKNTYTNNLTLEAGKRYGVFIYYHNNASGTLNDAAHNYVGVARESKVVSNFPHEIAAGETKQISGLIRSTTTNPEAVWDEANVTAAQDLTLHYVTGSAKITNDWGANGSVLSMHLFEEGDLIGTNDLNGLVLGCYEYSGYITYTLEAQGVDNPTPPADDPDPDPDPVDDPVQPETPNTPATPKELPKTGPVEMIVGFVVIAMVVFGFAYAFKSNKTYKKATQTKGGKSSKKK